MTELSRKLEQVPFVVDEAYPDAVRAFDGARWEMQLKVRLPEEDRAVELRVAALSSERLSTLHIEGARLDESEQERAAQSVWSIGLSTYFGAEPVRDYHRQLKVLAALCPDAVVGLDATSCEALHWAWVKQTAASQVPPSPRSLFVIHAVQEDPQARGAWLHTHGLLRCGLPEVEMFEIPTEATEPCSQLLNSVAVMFLDMGLPDPGVAFEAASQTKLVWQPWERAIGKLPRSRLGGRADRDPAHAAPSAVLFAPRSGFFARRLRSPAIYASHLADNPVFYIPSQETLRMAALARERLAEFRDLFEHHRDAQRFVFLVKLGYPVVDATSEGDREHLWFEVHDFLESDRVEATLRNAPYHVAGMSEGQRGDHSLALLTDWTILCEHGQFTPDNVFYLRRRLAATGALVDVPR